MSWFCLSFRPQHSISFFLTGSQHPIPTLDSGSVGGYKGVDETDWKSWNWLTYWWAEDLSSPINTIKTHNWTEVVTKQKLRVSFEIFGFIAVSIAWPTGSLSGQARQTTFALSCLQIHQSLCPSISFHLTKPSVIGIFHLYSSILYISAILWLQPVIVTGRTLALDLIGNFEFGNSLSLSRFHRHVHVL